VLSVTHDLKQLGLGREMSRGGFLLPSPAGSGHYGLPRVEHVGQRPTCCASALVASVRTRLAANPRPHGLQSLRVTASATTALIYIYIYIYVCVCVVYLRYISTDGILIG